MPQWPSFCWEQLIQFFLLFGSQQFSIVQSTRFRSEFQQPIFMFKFDELTIPIKGLINIVLIPDLLVVLIFFELVVLIVRCGSVL